MSAKVYQVRLGERYDLCFLDLGSQGRERCHAR